MRQPIPLGEDDDDWITPLYLDASALVKLLLDEPGSEAVRKLTRGSSSPIRTTPICFAETCGVLKRKFLKNDLTKDQYIQACAHLAILPSSSHIELEEVPLAHPEIFQDASIIVEHYNIDIVDAMQIVTIKKGSFASFAGKSKPVLVTADSDLAEAAEAEGIRISLVGMQKTH